MNVLPAARSALAALVRIPSVSATPTADLVRSAELTATLFRDAGMPEVEIIGNNAVLARHPAPPGRPTVLLYAHHDVQPAGKLDQPAVRTVGTRRPAVRPRHGRRQGRHRRAPRGGPRPWWPAAVWCHGARGR